MLTLNPADTAVPKLHEFLISSVAPRPICFASTIDKEGNVNLSPFSFFNVFSAHPPILIFSPAKSGRTGKTKHTFDNVKEVAEVVINIANYDMIQQMSLSSTEFPKGVNEFEKAGFTELKSDIVKPPRVQEAPVQIECKVNQIIELGDKGGAGNLIICEVLLMHVNEKMLGEDGSIDPYKMDYIARMSKNFYARIIPEAIIEVPKPNPAEELPLGFDQLPEGVRRSKYLTGNELASLASEKEIPSEKSLFEMGAVPEIKTLIDKYGHDFATFEREMHLLAAQEIAQDNRWFAWKVLMVVEYARESLI